MRWCTACGYGKQLSSFSRSAHLPGGYMFECKECRAAARVAKSRESLEKLERKIAHDTTTVKEKSARVSTERLRDTREAERYVASVQSHTRCGQCDRLGVVFCHPARDSGGKILVAGFTTMSEIDGRIEDMVPLCSICKPLIEKGKLKTHLFD